MSLQLPDFSQLNIIVMGDVMLDRYWHGDVSRISPEAPVPVVNIKRDKTTPGAAANVAACLRALGCTVSLYGVVGKDESAEILLGALADAGINNELLIDDNAMTITKLRVLDQARHQQLIRLDFEMALDEILDENRPMCDLEPLYKRYCEQIAGGKVDAVILSDYAKQTVLRDPQLFIKAARRADIPVFVDPKRADLTAYRGATLLTPNTREFTAAVGHCVSEADFINKGLEIVHEQALDALLVTRGAKGMTLVQKDNTSLQFATRAREVFDVTGAGDMVITMLAVGCAAKLPLPDAVELANLAAGLVVKKVGAASLSTAELHSALRDQQDSEQSILTQAELRVAIEEARQRNQRIVFTNGCFDILHPGHVAYLAQARALGDCLIVGVNDDESVARLKGSDRPINSLSHRLSVLAALRSVSWVVPFSGDTPEQLIRQVAPDVLVKGGDYTPDTVVGAEFVRRYGGKVKILDYIAGHSTTKILDKITTC